MKYVYCLIHTYDNADDEPEQKILAYFLTEPEAYDARKKYEDLPGFSKYPNGFIVDKIELGKLYWQDGFETVLDDEPI